MPDSLYIIDVFSLVFQVFHAIPPMTGPAGQPTNAVFGFTRDLLTILRGKRPTHIVCAMDSPGSGVRNELYPEYKANRDEMPPDLQPQIPMIVEIMSGFRIPMIACPGWEADDVLATVTRRCHTPHVDVSIVTGDKDARQLLGPGIRLYNVRKDTFIDDAYLLEDWGVRPDQVIDFQALVGDSVDNVPGVPLIGPKKASALLQQFGTLEEVLAHSNEAPGQKLRENLKTYADQALLSRRLVTLNTELPLDIELDALRLRQPDIERLSQLFREYGFQRFGEEVRALAADAGLVEAPEPAPSKPVQASLFPGPERRWETVDTEDKFREFLSQLRAQPKFCLDLETTSLDAVRADIVGWAFSWEAGDAFYVPVQGPTGQRVLDPHTVLDVLRPLLENPNVEITNQNIKYDMLVLRRAGVRLQGVGVDPMVGSYLLDAGARSHGLDALAEKYLNHRMIPISDLIGKGKPQKKMFEVDVARVAEYASEDADAAWQLATIIGNELRRESLWDLYWNLERPLITVLADMEFAGIRVDVAELQRQSADVGLRLGSLVDEIYGIAGREFNIESHKQLREILFGELKLPVLKKTKTGPSTDQSVLEDLAALHPLPAKITEHRGLAKLKGTYLDALPEMVNPETGRIHTSFNQVVAATGRLSSNEPNLQNIPIRTEEGRRVRRAFIPGAPDWSLVCADYSQIELRMLAHFSQDAALRTAFEAGADIHTSVAAEVFGVSQGAVTSDMRRVAKAVNFGVIYGQSPFGLAAALNIEQESAAEFIENYFGRYAGIDRYLTQLLNECARTGYARTILGRRRAITGVRPHPGRQRNMPERTAINTVVQGSAADLIKQAMINVHCHLAETKHPGRMLLQIHDELVFEVPDDETQSLVDLVRHEMETALPLSVPLLVDVVLGKNWLNVE